MPVKASNNYETLDRGEFGYHADTYRFYIDLSLKEGNYKQAEQFHRNLTELFSANPEFKDYYIELCLNTDTSVRPVGSDNYAIADLEQNFHK